MIGFMSRDIFDFKALELQVTGASSVIVFLLFVLFQLRDFPIQLISGCARTQNVKI